MSSGILCCVVSRGTTILAKYAGLGLTMAGNLSQAADQVLAKITPGDTRVTLDHGDFQSHYISAGGIITLAIAKTGFDRLVAFEFLEKIAEKFKTQYGHRANSAIAYAMNNDFSLVIANEMNRYNNPDKIKVLQKDLESVKVQMNENVEVVMQRGEKLDVLIEKTEILSNNSSTFRRNATTLQRKIWWKNMKLTIGAVVGVIILIYIIVSFSCGGLAWQNCV